MSPTPAFDAWHKRLASGELHEDPKKSSTWVLDDLWRAACREMYAIEEPWRATMYVMESFEILNDAAEREERGAA